MRADGKAVYTDRENGALSVLPKRPGRRAKVAEPLQRARVAEPLQLLGPELRSAEMLAPSG
jgi:hypothetical protein